MFLCQSVSLDIPSRPSHPSIRAHANANENLEMLKYPQGGGPGRERARGKMQERIQSFVDVKINWYLGHLDLGHGMWREVEYGELVVPRRSSGDSRGRWQGPGLVVEVWEGSG